MWLEANRPYIVEVESIREAEATADRAGRVAALGGQSGVLGRKAAAEII